MWNRASDYWVDQVKLKTLYNSADGIQSLFVAGVLPTFSPSATSQAIAINNQGDAMIDTVFAKAKSGSDWLSRDGAPLPVNYRVDLYGPYAAAQAQGAVPSGASPVRTRTFTANNGSSSVEVDFGTGLGAGQYYAVVRANKADQSEPLASYWDSDFTADFADPTETFTIPTFAPTATSEATKVVNPGDNISDVVQVNAAVGSVWPKIDGAFLPVTYRVKLYGPYSVPQTPSAAVPAGAPQVDSKTITATGPGSSTVNFSTNLAPGFYHVVITATAADQIDQMQPYWKTDGDFAAAFADLSETVSVRHAITITSEASEQSVNSGSFVMDGLTIAGFPEDHPAFKDDDRYAADANKITVSLMGPFTDYPTTAACPAGAKTVASVTVDAKNQTIRVGTNAEFSPTKAGWYVFVASFAGDDRVQPYTSGCNERLEQFNVGGSSLAAQFITKAGSSSQFVPTQIWDTITAFGDVPAGSQAELKLYLRLGDQADPATDQLICTQTVDIDGSGYYQTDSCDATKAGYYYWSEVFTDADGDTLQALTVDRPGESVTVGDVTPPSVTTKAQASATVGQDFYDTAIVSGFQKGDDSNYWLVFRAYGPQSDGAPTCTDKTLLYESEPIKVTGDGNYPSGSIKANAAGDVYWVETLTLDGQSIAAGECGLPDETTHVTAAPVAAPVAPADPTVAPNTAQTPTGVGSTGFGFIAKNPLVILLAGLTLAGVVYVTTRTKKAKAGR